MAKDFSALDKYLLPGAKKKKASYSWFELPTKVTQRVGGGAAAAAPGVGPMASAEVQQAFARSDTNQLALKAADLEDPAEKKPGLVTSALSLLDLPLRASVAAGATLFNELPDTKLAKMLPALGRETSEDEARATLQADAERFAGSKAVRDRGLSREAAVAQYLEANGGALDEMTVTRDEARAERDAAPRTKVDINRDGEENEGWGSVLAPFTKADTARTGDLPGLKLEEGESGGVKAAKLGGAFALDMALNPVNYVGGGAGLGAKGTSQARALASTSIARDALTTGTHVGGEGIESLARQGARIAGADAATGAGGRVAAEAASRIAAREAELAASATASGLDDAAKKALIDGDDVLAQLKKARTSGTNLAGDAGASIAGTHVDDLARIIPDPATRHAFLAGDDTALDAMKLDAAIATGLGDEAGDALFRSAAAAREGTIDAAAKKFGADAAQAGLHEGSAGYLGAYRSVFGRDEGTRLFNSQAQQLTGGLRMNTPFFLRGADAALSGSAAGTGGGISRGGGQLLERLGAPGAKANDALKAYNRGRNWFMGNPLGFVSNNIGRDGAAWGDLLRALPVNPRAAAANAVGTAERTLPEAFDAFLRGAGAELSADDAVAAFKAQAAQGPQAGSLANDGSGAAPAAPGAPQTGSGLPTAPAASPIAPVPASGLPGSTGTPSLSDVVTGDDLLRAGLDDAGRAELVGPRTQHAYEDYAGQRDALSGRALDQVAATKFHADLTAGVEGRIKEEMKASGKDRDAVLAEVNTIYNDALLRDTNRLTPDGHLDPADVDAVLAQPIPKDAAGNDVTGAKAAAWMLRKSLFTNYKEQLRLGISDGFVDDMRRVATRETQRDGARAVFSTENPASKSGRAYYFTDELIDPDGDPNGATRKVWDSVENINAKAAALGQPPVFEEDLLKVVYGALENGDRKIANERARRLLLERGTLTDPGTIEGRKAVRGELSDLFASYEKGQLARTKGLEDRADVLDGTNVARAQANTSGSPARADERVEEARVELARELGLPDGDTTPLADLIVQGTAASPAVRAEVARLRTDFDSLGKLLSSRLGANGTEQARVYEQLQRATLAHAESELFKAQTAKASDDAVEELRRTWGDVKVGIDRATERSVRPSSFGTFLAGRKADFVPVGTSDAALKAADRGVVVDAPKLFAETLAAKQVAEALERSMVLKDPKQLGTLIEDFYLPLNTLWKGSATTGLFLPKPGFTARNVSGGWWNAYQQGAELQDWQGAFRAVRAISKARASVKGDRDAGTFLPEDAGRLDDKAIEAQLDLIPWGKGTMGDVYRVMEREQVVSSNIVNSGVLGDELSIKAAADGKRDLWGHIQDKSELPLPARAGIKAGNWLVNNKVSKLNSDTNQLAEQYIRWGTMLAQTRKYGNDEAGRGIAAIATLGTQFDYTNLSPLERKIVRYAQPFWVWSSRNIPFQVRNMAYNPRGVNALYGANDSLRQGLQNEDERYSEDGVLPKYSADIGGWVTGLNAPGSENPVFAQLNSPLMDAERMLALPQDPLSPSSWLDVVNNASEDTKSSLNPFVKAGVENLSGASTFTGSAFGETDAPWWALPFSTPDPEDGTPQASERVVNTAETLLPLAGQLDRLYLPTGARRDQQATGWWNNTVGGLLPITVTGTMTEERIQGSLRGTNQDREDAIADFTAEAGIDKTWYREVVKSAEAQVANGVMTEDDAVAWIQDAIASAQGGANPRGTAPWLLPPPEVPVAP